jgi:predicted permease
MVVVPALALGAAVLFRLPPAAATALVVLFSCPPALHSYILASEYGTYEQESDGIILLSILISVLSIPAFIYACQMIWVIS